MNTKRDGRSDLTFVYQQLKLNSSATHGDFYAQENMEGWAFWNQTPWIMPRESIFFFLVFLNIDDEQVGTVTC